MTEQEKTLRAKCGIEATQVWPAYAWPGGYPFVYLADDCETICPSCVNNEENIHFDGDADGWRVDAVDVYYEGPTLFCAHCNEGVESAYGDPEEER